MKLNNAMTRPDDTEPSAEARQALSEAHQAAADQFAVEMPGVDRDSSLYWQHLLFDHYALALDRFRAAGVRELSVDFRMIVYAALNINDHLELHGGGVNDR